MSDGREEREEFQRRLEEEQSQNKSPEKDQRRYVDDRLERDQTYDWEPERRDS